MTTYTVRTSNHDGSESTLTTTNRKFALITGEALSRLRVGECDFFQVEVEDQTHTVIWATYPPEAGNHPEGMTWTDVQNRRSANYGVVQSVCSCESSYCAHPAGSCPRKPSGRFLMQFVGDVCDECAATARNNGGSAYIFEVPSREVSK